MPLSFAEKLLVLYRTSRPQEYTETRGSTAIAWSQNIIQQLTGTKHNQLLEFINPRFIIEKFVAGGATTMEVEALASRLLFEESAIALNPQLVVEKLVAGGATNPEISSILDLLA